MVPEAQSVTAPWREILDYSFPAGWSGPTAVGERIRACCSALERGEILYFSSLPYDFTPSTIEFLLAQRRGDSRLHKNISYRPTQDLLRGAEGDAATQARLHQIMRDYSAAVVQFAAALLAPYSGQWKLDYASFRPLEEAGRNLPLHKRNDLLHVDAFPSRPTFGARILRVFTNISPKPRVWLTGERFTQLAPRLAQPAGLDTVARPEAFAGAKRALRALGLPLVARSPYDRFMLRFHDWLKENTDFQQNSPRDQVSFPPLSTWLVMTDCVPHAALSGQFALEQTFIVPLEACVAPEAAPIRVLEGLAGRKLQ